MKDLIDYYKDRIYFTDENGDTYLNLKTVKAIAIAAGLIRPQVMRH